MKAEYKRVGPDPTGTAVGKIRKMRCKCTGDGLLTGHKLYEEGTPWEQSKVNFFMDGAGHIERCPKCDTGLWYTS